MWNSLLRKLEKSGRKWAETDYIPYRFARLFCVGCGKDLGRNFDIANTDLKAHQYCLECVKPYILTTPFKLDDGIEVVADRGNDVTVKYIGGYYPTLETEKLCYFNSKGRFIKIKGKTYYLKEKKE